MAASPRLRPGIALAAVVLAAGAGSRFSDRPGEKLLASVDGQPILARVLATLRDFRPAATVVVLGHGADAIERALEWVGEVRVRNPTPERGIASSLRVGFDELKALRVDADGAFVVLADQPDLRVATLHALAQAAGRTSVVDRVLIVPRYRNDPGPLNPVLVLRSAWPLIGDLDGDKGLATFIIRHPELCAEVPVAGAMPDVDTPTDLERLTTGG